MDRIEIINSLIKVFSYQKYLEVGCGRNVCFNQVLIGHKVGVDPNRGGTLRMTSDDFFRENCENFDIVLVDGLHQLEQVQRDINNSLRFLNRNGTIVVHDLNPATKAMQQVPRVTKQWTGDCWKAWMKIRAERSDLLMFTVDVDHGVGLIRNGHHPPFGLPAELSFEALDANRRAWLNLIDEDSFNVWLGRQI